MTLFAQMDNTLQQSLEEHDVQVVQPRERMIQLNGVQAGDQFSKPATNVLLRQRRPETWEIFVDDDFYYVGDDPQRRSLFCGDRTARWAKLELQRAIHGDVNEAIITGLSYIDSPILERLPRSPERPVPEDGDVSDRLAGIGTLLDNGLLRQNLVQPVGSQAETVQHLVEVVSRRMPPYCPLLLGPSGSGRTTLATQAAATLVRRGVVRHVVALSGADLSSGSLFVPQRDDRLHAVLQALVAVPDTLVLFEQFQLVVGQSPIAATLLADALDARLRVIAIPPWKASLGIVSTHVLSRRMEAVRVRPLESTDVRRVVEWHLARHPLAERVHVAPEVVPVVLRLSSRRKAANPAAALGLLDAVLTHAEWSDAKCVGPDDVYHLVETTNSRAKRR